MKETKPISIAILAAIFLSCLLAMSIQSQPVSNDELSTKDKEIAALKSEIEILKSGKEINSAGLNSIAVNILIMLLFSAGVGFISAFWVKRRTRSMCHCHIKRLKLMKKMAEAKRTI
ncbi:MAG: hypothetical protein IAE93_15030 [Ignavibacteria bacterium]|nr:hypothetical protein [Ignavibacteria bacterium]